MTTGQTKGRSQFTRNTLNFIHNKQIASGPVVPHQLPELNQTDLTLLEKQIKKDAKYETLKAKLSTHKYKEGIFGKVPNLPNLTLSPQMISSHQFDLQQQTT